jgi:hypothetical protein
MQLYLLILNKLEFYLLIIFTHLLYIYILILQFGYRLYHYIRSLLRLVLQKLFEKSGGGWNHLMRELTPELNSIGG